jgi:hypothetical protein
MINSSMKRIRISPTVIAYSLYLYFNSRSYRFASKSLEPIIKKHMSKFGNGYNIDILN